MFKLLRNNKRRYVIGIIFTFAYTLCLIFLTAEAQWNTFAGQLLAVLFFTGPLIFTYLIGMIWRYDLHLTPVDDAQASHNQQTTTKRKRKAIDDVLRDLFDDDLIELRNRLQDRAIDNEELYDQFISDDGELVYHQTPIKDKNV